MLYIYYPLNLPNNPEIRMMMKKKIMTMVVIVVVISITEGKTREVK